MVMSTIICTFVLNCNIFCGFISDCSPKENVRYVKYLIKENK